MDCSLGQAHSASSQRFAGSPAPHLCSHRMEEACRVKREHISTRHRRQARPSVRTLLEAGEVEEGQRECLCTEKGD